MNTISNISEYTVSQLNKSIKNIIENSFFVVKVVGEISQVKKHSSGHIYFTLKDSESTISAVCWRSNTSKLKVDVEEGKAVLVKGKVTTYSPQSKYQLIVEQIEYQGEGELLKLLEDRKKKLAEQGFFDTENKKKIPELPKNIGVITSETGAVFRDIIHRISDRFPSNLLLFPARVQGENSVQEICDGIDFFNSLPNTNENKPDVIIIARGGGSLEDLMPFNDEKIVIKVFNSEIPIISAVGHETDTTLCDFAADLRSPTPTAAAEMVVPDRNQIWLRISDKFIALEKNIKNILKEKKNELQLTESQIPDIEQNINNSFQNIDFQNQKLKTSLENKISDKKICFFEISKRLNFDKVFDNLKLISERLIALFEKFEIKFGILMKDKNKDLELQKRKLDILSYKETLRRGYAVVKKGKKVISDNADAKVNDNLEVEFSKSTMLVKKIQ